MPVIDVILPNKNYKCQALILLILLILLMEIIQNRFIAWKLFYIRVKL